MNAIKHHSILQLKSFVKGIRLHNLIMAFIVLAIYAANIFWRPPTTTKPPMPTVSSCRNCHKNICDSFMRTAHYITSRPASKEFIKGSFDSTANTFMYNKFMYVQMDNVDDSFFQTSVVNNTAFETEPFDIVIGSGKKGQSYLYWNNDKLFQLPISYYTAQHSWCNSPGYPTSFVNFNRQVNAQCLECHGSYAKATTTAATGAIFEQNSIVYGIECERCHGAAAEHIDYYTKNPQATGAKYITNPESLTRTQRLDACALCHSGLRKETQPAFSFKVGDRLDDFSQASYDPDSTAMLDVHGNQYGLLTASKCFRLSQMDCSSCHNVHEKEAGDLILFSQRCQSCHNETNHDTCTIKTRNNIVLANNCIDCHMPLLPSKKIFLQLSDREKSTADFVRTHRVAIYSKETAEYLKAAKARKN